MTTKKIRIQTFLAQAGVGSRRQCDQMVIDQRVSINGVTAKIGELVCVQDVIHVDGGRIISGETQSKLYMLNKPVGYICSTRDENDIPSVFHLLPRIKKGRWCFVGRLDVQTSGLILFSNSGSLAHRLTHPKFKLKRRYLVRVFGIIDDVKLQRLRDGIHLDGKEVKCSLVERHGKPSTSQNHWLMLELSVGYNRVVRRLCESLSWHVTRLKRIGFGALKLPKELDSGQSIELDLEQFLKIHKIEL